MPLPWQTRGDQTERERCRSDEGDLLRVRVEQTGGELTRVLHLRGGQERFLVALGAERGIFANGFGNSAGQGADTGMGEKNPVARHGKFVTAQVFIGKKLGQCYQTGPKGHPSGRVVKRQIVIAPNFSASLAFSDAAGGKLFSVREFFLHTLRSSQGQERQPSLYQ